MKGLKCALFSAMRYIFPLENIAPEIALSIIIIYFATNQLKEIIARGTQAWSRAKYIASPHAILASRPRPCAILHSQRNFKLYIHLAVRRQNFHQFARPFLWKGNYRREEVIEIPNCTSHSGLVRIGNSGKTTMYQPN